MFASSRVNTLRTPPLKSILANPLYLFGCLTLSQIGSWWFLAVTATPVATATETATTATAMPAVDEAPAAKEDDAAPGAAPAPAAPPATTPEATDELAAWAACSAIWWRMSGLG
jgi:hypothetical protein